MALKFNPNFDPNAAETAGISYIGPDGNIYMSGDWLPALSGWQELVPQGTRTDQLRLQKFGNQLKLIRPGGDKNTNEFMLLNVDPSTGTVQPMGGWQRERVDSLGKMLGQALAVGGLGLAGLGLAGTGPLAGLGGSAGGAGAAGTAGAGAGAGAGSAASLGALAEPVTLAGGASLSSPLTLGGAAAADAGLSTAGMLGGGIGGGLPASALGALGSTVGASPTGSTTGASGGGAAGSSSLPSWFQNLGVKGLSQLATLGLAGGALGAAASSDKINTDSLAALARLGDEQGNIARSEYEKALQRQAMYDPKFAEILDATLATMRNQNQRSDQLWDSYVTNFLPNAEKFAQTALNYDTEGRRNEAEAAARGRVATDFAQARKAQERNLARAGITLDSGTALALDRAARLTEAKAAGGAGDLARRNVEATGLGLMQAAAGLGQGVVGTSQQQAGQGLTAGQAGASTMGQQQTTYNQTLAPTQAFYGGATSATGAASGQSNAVQLQQQAQRNAGYAGLGNLLGTVLTAPKDSWLGSILGG